MKPPSPRLTLLTLLFTASCALSVSPIDAATATASDTNDAPPAVDVRSINCRYALCPDGYVCVIEECSDRIMCTHCHPIPPGCPPTMGCPPGSDGGQCACTPCDAMQCAHGCIKSDFNPIGLACI